MNKLHGRRALLSTLPAFLSGKGSRSLGALHERRRRLPPLVNPAGGAAVSSLSSFSTHTAAGKPARSAAALASQEPVTTTLSRCTPVTVAGRHMFEIAGYSLVKGLSAGNFVESGTFFVGGYDWCIRYYPDGLEEYSSCDPYCPYDEDEDEDEDDENYISLFLSLMSKDTADVRALCELKLVDPATGMLPASCCGSNRRARTRTFSREHSTWGFGKFMERIELEIKCPNRHPLREATPMATSSHQPASLLVPSPSRLTSPS
jgi:hypothetical protein